METAALYQTTIDRSTIIGASDIGAIIGVDKYRTAIDVWLEKTGQTEPFEGNKYTEAGRRLEPVILSWFAEEEGVTVTPNSEFVHHATISYIGCTPDGYTDNDGLVEAKNTSRDIDTVDYQYFAQLQYQLAVTGRSWGALVYLCKGFDLKVFRYDAQPEVGAALIEEAQRFWMQHVVTGIPPEPRDGENPAKLYSQHTEGLKIEAVPEVAELVEKLQRTRKVADWCEGRAKRLEGQIKAAMKDAESLLIDGRVAVTWRTSRPAMRIDAKRLRLEQPAIAERYSTTDRPTRKFILKERGNT